MRAQKVVWTKKHTEKRAEIRDMKAEPAERLTAPEKKIDDGSLTTHAVSKAISPRFKVDKRCSLKNILKVALC